MNYCPECGSELSSREVEGRERSYCENCSEIIWRNPKPVAGVIVRKDGKYLLIKRDIDPDRGEWDIPGGFLELEESFREGAVRELEEETGLKVDGEELEPVDTVAFERLGEFIVGLVFTLEVRDANLEAGSDAADARFWDIEELENSEETLRDMVRETEGIHY